MATGCAPTDASAPEHADTAEVIDVDGDGLLDTAWITPEANRRFGITTASGATFSLAITSASPIPASAIVQRIGADDLPIALVDTGRSVQLLSIVDCQLQRVKNDQGEPYIFDKGFTGYGTGVACLSDGSLRLAGLEAEPNEKGNRFTVTRTWVDLAADGATASNGAHAVIAKNAKKSADNVVLAYETSCGEFVAGTDGPVERDR